MIVYQEAKRRPNYAFDETFCTAHASGNIHCAFSTYIFFSDVKLDFQIVAFYQKTKLMYFKMLIKYNIPISKSETRILTRIYDAYHIINLKQIYDKIMVRTAIQVVTVDKALNHTQVRVAYDLWPCCIITDSSIRTPYPDRLSHWNTLSGSTVAFFGQTRTWPSSCLFVLYNWAASWENQRFAYAKTKTQISFAVTAKLIAVTAKLISAFVFAT